jgi:hypothetical protein
MFDYWKSVDFMPKAVSASIEATSAVSAGTVNLTNYWIGGSLVQSACQSFTVPLKV